jgi:hypothetical protein
MTSFTSLEGVFRKPKWNRKSTTAITIPRHNIPCSMPFNLQNTEVTASQNLKPLLLRLG